MTAIDFIHRILVAKVATVATALAISANTFPATESGYMEYASVTRTVQELAASNPRCSADVIGASRQGRGLHVLTLAANQANAANQPAMLITAGLDARHRVGVETALRIARRLLNEHAEALENTTVYIIPCVNPDGMEYNLGKVSFGHGLTLRVMDEDRDGAADEDGPADLNGDGYITMMRRANPPLDDVATHMADPVEPRLLKKPSAEKGERAVYSVYVEGHDADGDGKIAEDGPGGVELEKNFMHRWPEFDLRAGPTQICEPESAALAKFVLDHRNIVVAINYGRHDNIINVSDGKAKDLSGQAPKDLDEADVEYYRELSKVYKDLTGQQRAVSEDTGGALHAWLYAQRGIPSFAINVWGRPDALKPEEEAQSQAASQSETQPASRPEQSQTQTATAPASETKSDAKAQAGADAKQEKKKDEPKPADAEAAAWLEYSDRDRNKQGFIEWQPFNHPTLGSVEVGGFVPGFRMNPPADQLDTLAEKQTAFVVELLKRKPALTTEGPIVTRLGEGVYEIRFGVKNEGYLPTATSIARKARSIMPTIVKLSLPIESILSGDRVSRAWGIGGSGERISHRWIVRMNDGASASIDINNPQLGAQTVPFTATDSKAAQTQPATAPQTQPATRSQSSQPS
jgi:murein tripeptide amidase MpaA